MDIQDFLGTEGSWECQVYPGPRDFKDPQEKRETKERWAPKASASRDPVDRGDFRDLQVLPALVCRDERETEAHRAD